MWVDVQSSPSQSAVAKCTQIHARLLEHQDEDLSEELLRQSLAEFKQCIELDPGCVEARFGIVYVCGHLDLYEQGRAELELIESMGFKDDERVESMRALLSQMEEGGDADDLDQEEDVDDEEEWELGPTVPGLLQHGAPTEKFMTVLANVFDRFDLDHDGAWVHAELDAFHRQVNNAPLSHETHHFLTEHFETDEHGNLAKDGFISFYVGQTQGDAEETWKDLRNLGYNRDLDPI